MEDFDRFIICERLGAVDRLVQVDRLSGPDSVGAVARPRGFDGPDRNQIGEVRCLVEPESTDTGQKLELVDKIMPVQQPESNDRLRLNLLWM